MTENGGGVGAYIYRNSFIPDSSFDDKSLYCTKLCQLWIQASDFNIVPDECRSITNVSKEYSSNWACKKVKKLRKIFYHIDKIRGAAQMPPKNLHLKTNESTKPSSIASPTAAHKFIRPSTAGKMSSFRNIKMCHRSADFEQSNNSNKIRNLLRHKSIKEVVDDEDLSAIEKVNNDQGSNAEKGNFKQKRSSPMNVTNDEKDKSDIVDDESDNLAASTANLANTSAHSNPFGNGNQFFGCKFIYINK